MTIAYENLKCIDRNARNVYVIWLRCVLTTLKNLEGEGILLPVQIEISCFNQTSFPILLQAICVYSNVYNVSNHLFGL